MRIANVDEERIEHEFALRATLDMSENPSHYTFADGDPTPGNLFAIRWNPFTVLVVKLDEFHNPSCYPTHQLIQKDLPPLKGEPNVNPQ